MRYFILLLSTLLAFPALAGEEDNTPPPPQLEVSPEQPDIPASAKSGQVLKPDTTVTRSYRKPVEKADGTVTREEDDDTVDIGNIHIKRKDIKGIQEYRRSGRRYMIKVTPIIGPAYYFIDTDGDGNLDARSDNPNLDSNVNMWKIVEWE
jgi:hypothetical protein